jgi:hypothetical protein
MWSPDFRDTWLNLIDSPLPYFYIEDCIVDPHTGLIYKNGEIVWEACNENLVWSSHKSTTDWIRLDSRWQNRISRFGIITDRMEYFKSYIDKKISFSNLIANNSNICLHLLHPFGRYVPGHVFDTLQKLYIVEQNRLSFNTILLADSSEMIDFNLHLEILGLNKINHIYSKSDELLSIKKLLFIQPVSHPTTFTKDSFTFIRKKYFEYFSVDENLKPNNKIFLIRRKNKFKRNLINEVEIEITLSKIGVTVVDGSENFSELIRLFSSSSHIAGIHGSLFMNSIFGNKSAKYLEYCPSTRIVKTFYDAYKFCHSYDFKVAESASSYDISIDPDELIKFYST